MNPCPSFGSNISTCSNISHLLEDLDRDLIEKMLEPIIINDNRKSLLPLDGLSKVELICKNPDKELPFINKPQLNFQVLGILKNSNEPIIIEIKRTIGAYITTYEKKVRDINTIVDFIRKRIINVFNPLKPIKLELQNFAIEFETGMNNLAIQIKNKNDILNSINPDSSKISQFEKYKNLLLKEISIYYQETKIFHKKYSKLNHKNLKMVENFFTNFLKLISPAQEFSLTLIKEIEKFENSATTFGNAKNIQEILDLLAELNLRTKDIQNKFENIRQIYDNIEEIKPEKQEDIKNTLNEMKEINQGLKKKSDKITKKIEELRKTYKCSQVQEMSMKTVSKIKDDKVFQILPDLSNYLRLDILFIMDITGSMDEYLNQVKTETENMVQIIQKAFLTADIFLAFVGYRDISELGYGEEYVNIEFTQNYRNLIDQIKDVVAEGGRDIPEDLAGAFELSLNKDWKGRSKLAILVTDAPCHGKKYHNLVGELKDNFPEGDPLGRNIEGQIALFAQKEINLFCKKITDLTDLMFDTFKNIYERNKPKNSNCNFVIEKEGKISDIVTRRAIEIYGKKEDFSMEEE